MNPKVIGTCLQGYVDESYARLVEVFGQPGPGDGYKLDAQWVVEEGGVVATIYNYKDGVNYNGADGWPTESLRDWHIGGHDHQAVDLVYRRLGYSRERQAKV